jgi:hypothetical protein
MKRTLYIQARVNEPEYHALNVIALRGSINPSEALRSLIRAECDRVGIPISKAKPYEEFALAEAQNGKPS